jgi:hypothetical protein
MLFCSVSHDKEAAGDNKKLKNPNFHHNKDYTLKKEHYFLTIGLWLK